MLIATLMTLSLSVAAQSDYFGYLLYDLKGPVESVDSDARYYPRVLGAKRTFLKNGMLSFSALNYDENGYPIGSMANYSKAGDKKQKGECNDVEIVYDEKNRPSSIFESYHFKNREDILTTYSYSPDGTIAGATIKITGNDNKIIEMSYSDYKYDSSGNWISRKVDCNVVSISGKGNKTENSTYRETRKIKYFGN